MTLDIKLSASSIEKWHTCKRRWAFTYILGLREPFAKSAQAGTEVHKRLEDDNIVPGETWSGYEVGHMAGALKAATPAGILTREEKFEIEIDGIRYVGTMDGRGAQRVLDYKTTSKRKYVKSLKVLETDPQRLLYAEVHKEATECTWLYGVWEELPDYLSGKKKPVERTAPIERVADRERFKLHVLAPSEEILTLSPGTDPLSLPLPPMYLDRYKSPCGKFPPAGCPHKNRCFPPTMKVSMSTKSSLFDTLVGENAAPVSDGQHLAELPRAVQGVAAAPEGQHSRGAVSDVSAPGTQYAVEILFVDCFPLYPLDEPLTFAHPLISRASASVADDNGVIHARLIDFRKGLDQLAVQLQYDLKQKPVKYLHLETKSDEGRACLQPLMAVARRVVKGAF